VLGAAGGGVWYKLSSSRKPEPVVVAERAVPPNELPKDMQKVIEDARNQALKNLTQARDRDGFNKTPFVPPSNMPTDTTNPPRVVDQNMDNTAVQPPKMPNFTPPVPTGNPARKVTNPSTARRRARGIVSVPSAGTPPLVPPAPTSPFAASNLPSEQWSELFDTEEDFQTFWKSGHSNPVYDAKEKKISILSSFHMGSLDVNQPWKEFQITIAPVLHNYRFSTFPLTMNVNGANFLVNLPKTTTPVHVTCVNENGQITLRASAGRSAHEKRDANFTAKDRLNCRFSSTRADIEIFLSKAKVLPK
jgi:hypothetical protein